MPLLKNRSDGHPWVVQVADVLRERGQTLGFAESCTGGLLSAIFTRPAGISSVFAGSVVCYSYEVKENLLHVPRTLLRTHGAVSLPVATAMAVNVRQALGSTWAVSVTGIAGPSGGTPDKPVGTVCFAVAGPGIEGLEFARRLRFNGDRRAVQLASARFALRLLLEALRVKPVVVGGKKS